MDNEIIDVDAYVDVDAYDDNDVVKHESPNQNLNEIDLSIMKFMLSNNYISPSRMVTTSMLTDGVEIDDGNGGLRKVSKTSIQNSIKRLVQQKFIVAGAKLGRTNRYFISANGALSFYEMNELSIEEKRALVKVYGLTVTKKDNSDNWEELYKELYPDSE